MLAYEYIVYYSSGWNNKEITDSSNEIKQLLKSRIIPPKVEKDKILQLCDLRDKLENELREVINSNLG